MVMMRKTARPRYGRVAPRRIRRTVRSRWSGSGARLARGSRIFLGQTTRHVAGHGRKSERLATDWLAAGGTVIAAASWGLLVSLLG